MKIVFAIAFLMLFAGILSAVLYFMNYNLKILAWMNDLPENTQWLIRGGLVTAGLLVIIVIKKKINTIK